MSLGAERQFGEPRDEDLQKLYQMQELVDRNPAAATALLAHHPDLARRILRLQLQNGVVATKEPPLAPVRAAPPPSAALPPPSQPLAHAHAHAPPHPNPATAHSVIGTLAQSNPQLRPILEHLMQSMNPNAGNPEEQLVQVLLSLRPDQLGLDPDTTNVFLGLQNQLRAAGL